MNQAGRGVRSGQSLDTKRKRQPRSTPTDTRRPATVPTPWSQYRALVMETAAKRRAPTTHTHRPISVNLARRSGDMRVSLAARHGSTPALRARGVGREAAAVVAAGGAEANASTTA